MNEAEPETGYLIFCTYITPEGCVKGEVFGTTFSEPFAIGLVDTLNAMKELMGDAHVPNEAYKEVIYHLETVRVARLNLAWPQYLMVMGAAMRWYRERFEKPDLTVYEDVELEA